MATLKDFMKWTNEISRYGKLGNCAIITGDEVPSDVAQSKINIKIFTDTNCYSITARDSEDDAGYLGCIASTRKPRAGEDWTRGNDLDDGDLTKETWYRILGDIISYEMVKVHKREEPSVFGVNVEGPSLAA